MTPDEDRRRRERPGARLSGTERDGETRPADGRLGDGPAGNELVGDGPAGDELVGDGRLRAALRALGDVPAPAGDLAGAALARDRRDRRRSVAVAVGTAVAVVAAIAVPALLVAHRPRTLPAGGPGAGSHVVEAYTAVGADRWLPGATSLLLDRASGAYVPVPVDWLAVSPDGQRVAVWDDADTGRPPGGVRTGTLPPLPVTGDGPQRAGVADRAALLRDGLAAVRWLPLGHPYRPVWSPDGRLLVSARRGPGSVTRVVVVDPATGRFARDVTVPSAVAAPDVAAASWAPDGTGFALPTRTGGPLLFFDWTGRRTGSWPVPAGSLALSPDGAYAVLTTTLDYRAGPAGWGVDGGAQLVLDRATGREVARFAGPVPVAGWHDPAHLLRPAPGRGGSVLDVVDLQGRVTGRVSVEPHRAGGLQLGPAAGLPPAAAGLRF